MKPGLGKGLGALISGVATGAEKSLAKENSSDAFSYAQPAIDGGVLMVDIRKVEPNPTQPRQYFNEEALDELAESMQNFGIIQPLLVTADGDHFSIIAGERRYRAARKAQLKEIPVIVKDYTEMEILQVALIENIQRQDLTSIEEATCYKRLMDDFFFSPDDVAGKLGKSKHAVISALHLLELSPRAQSLASEGKLTIGINGKFRFESRREKNPRRKTARPPRRSRKRSKSPAPSRKRIKNRARLKSPNYPRREKKQNRNRILFE
jgi:ParB family chromosome partitioning protein